MTFFHILVEGGADVPMVQEIMARRFNLVEGANFKIYPHKGRGKLPANYLSTPDINLKTAVAPDVDMIAL
jgi:hypothetical protein